MISVDAVLYGIHFGWQGPPEDLHAIWVGIRRQECGLERLQAHAVFIQAHVIVAFCDAGFVCGIDVTT